MLRLIRPICLSCNLVVAASTRIRLTRDTSLTYAKNPNTVPDTIPARTLYGLSERQGTVMNPPATGYMMHISKMGIIPQKIFY